MFDGICDQTRELKTVSGKMPNGETWFISSSGRHMFIDFVIDFVESKPGFLANIHYGNDIDKFAVAQFLDVKISKTYFSIGILTYKR